MRLFQQPARESEWEKLQNRRGVFLERAKTMPHRIPVIIDRLILYRSGVQLMSEEQVEHNTAKADDIMQDLERLLH